MLVLCVAACGPGEERTRAKARVCHVDGEEANGSEEIVLDESAPVGLARFTYGNGDEWTVLSACLTE